MEEDSFCRFCAEFKPVGKLYNLQSDVSLCKEIKLKVKYIQANFVNLCVEGNYPAAVCFVCKEALDHAYTFFTKVKKAQEVVSHLLTNPELFRIASEQSSDVEESCIKSESPVDILPEVVNPDMSEEVIPEGVISEEFISEEEIPVKEITVKEITEEEIPEFHDSCNDESLDVSQENDDDTTSEKSLSKIKKNESTDNNLKPESWNHMRWICEHCSDEFSDIQSLRTHSKFTHNKCRAFKCPECAKYQGAKSFNGFINHMRKHYVHLRKFCIYCNKSFANTRSTNNHSQDHLTHKSSCGHCGDIFDDQVQLQEHLNLYSLSQRNPKQKGEGYDIVDRTCKICNKVLKKVVSKANHMIIHQEKRPLYTCDRCGKTFLSKGALVSHLNSHSKEKKFCCDICNKTFFVRDVLVQHIIRHSDVKKFKCEECGKNFYFKRQLQDHRRVHTDYMPFNCEVCAKQFRRRSDLKKHKLQHTGEKPYSCGVCDKTFTDGGNRNKHMKRIHNRDGVKRLL